MATIPQVFFYLVLFGAAMVTTLTPGYLCVLWKVMTKTQLHTLVWIIVLLLLAQPTYMAAQVCLWLAVSHTTESGLDTTTVALFKGYVVGIFGLMISFNLSHWILAVQYWRLARKLQIYQQSGDTSLYDLRFRILLACGAAFFVVVPIAYLWANFALLNGQPVLFWTQVCYAVYSAGMLISAFIMIAALLVIYNTMKGTKDAQIATTAMLVHGGSFLLQSLGGMLSTIAIYEPQLPVFWTSFAVLIPAWISQAVLI